MLKALLPALVVLACSNPAPPASKAPSDSNDSGGGDSAHTGDPVDSADSADTASDTASDSGGDTGPSENTPVRLNQLVTRLLRVEDVTEDQAWTITRERPGWLFLTASLAEGASARVGVDVDDPADAQLVIDGEDEDPAEAMMEVAAGEHTVTIWLDDGALLDTVEVRAIPELRYDRFYPDAGLDEDVFESDWSFIETHADPHLTTMVADWHWNGIAYYGPWLESGRSWHTHATNGYGTKAELVDFYEYNIGVAAGVGIGLDLDEFGSTDDAQWEAWTAALSQVSADYPDTPLGLYTTVLPDSSEAHRDFVETMLGMGQTLLFEWYIGEKESEADLDGELDELSLAVAAARVDFPGFEDQTVLVLAAPLHSYVSFDYRPDVDFRVHLDRQFERVVTDENFQDLHGLAFWTAYYMDEEMLRWVMALYRHYGIEGATEPLSEDSYLLAHVQNPDFEAEDGWTLDTSGQIGIGEYEWISEYEARWTTTEDVGDTYLHTTRGAGRASTATQEIVGLEPGRTYSLRFFTIWYEDLYNLLGNDYDYERDHPVQATIEGAEVVDGSDVVVTCDSTWPGSGVWVNQHRLRFVPDGETATLTLSDSGASYWETYLFNFVQVQPYFDE